MIENILSPGNKVGQDNQKFNAPGPFGNDQKYNNSTNFNLSQRGAHAKTSLSVSGRSKITENQYDVVMSSNALHEAAALYPQFGIHAMSERKQKQLGSTISKIPAGDLFWDSVVLSKDAAKVVFIIFDVSYLIHRLYVGSVFHATFLYETSSL
jgi:hypothetical protein